MDSLHHNKETILGHSLSDNGSGSASGSALHQLLVKKYPLFFILTWNGI
jgi:hypothetical protein